MAINLLDKHTAELIAAGEVVERPASVVKELLENAIDAGATTVTVEIERGGVALIRVADNGSGITAADVPLAFVRHATSKVRCAKDLEAIQTLGFRGEALASVGSVARVRLLTHAGQDENATEALMEGGGQGPIQEAARGQGTTIEVRDLFYNTPARMKFLKKDASEGTYVTEVVGRVALSHTEVAVRYVRDGKPVFATPGDGDLRAAAWQVLGKDFAKDLLELDYGDGPYTVSGLITPPRAGRGSRSMQLFFVGGRYVKNRTMMAALEQAYRGVAMQGRFPGGLVFLQMPPELVDVNVHPAKTEVRFAREQEVFGMVYRAARAAVLDNSGEHTALQLGRPEGGEPAQPQAGQAAAASRPPAPPPHQINAYNHMVKTLAATAPPEGILAAPQGAIVYETKAPAPGGGPSMPAAVPVERGGWQSPSPWALDISADDEPEPMPQQTTLPGQPPAGAAPELRLVGEAFKTYILAEQGDTLCLIDKHAAHERLLYEKLAAARSGADIQLLLAPETVNLSAAEKDALLENTEALQAAGIELEDFGGGAVLVRGVPADVETTDVPVLVQEVAARMALNNKDSLNSKTEWVLHSVACRAAVKAGQHTPPQALLSLAQDIISGKVPPFCPHGRPVVLKLTRKELEKQFGRLG